MDKTACAMWDGQNKCSIEIPSREENNNGWKKRVGIYEAMSTRNI